MECVARLASVECRRISAKNKHKLDEPCVVWRKDLNSHYRSLDLAEYAAIQLVIAGASFGELCEKLQENATEEASNHAGCAIFIGLVK